MRHLLERRVGWRLWLLSLLLFAVFLVVVLPAEAERFAAATGVGESPDASYLYTADDLYRLAAAYGAEGRAYYIRSRFTFDIAWPLVYGLFLQCSMLLASRRTIVGRLPTPVVFVPGAAVVFDLLENTTAAIVMARFPDPTPVLAHAAPVFTFLKWNLLGAAFALAAFGMAAWVAQLVRRRRG